jgi:ABC-type nitrate/sulfonate/bicarbonate transport system substrate-binding protein
MSILTRSARGVAVIVLAVFACLFVPAAARADDTLTLITGASPTAFGELLNNVATRGGFYKEEHLNVVVQYAGSPNIGAQLVATGKGDVCSIAIEPLLLGYQKGLKLVAIYQRSPNYLFALGVLKDSPIKTLADFKGTTIGEYSVGSPAEISTNNMLSGAGLKRGDVTYIPIGNGAQAISALTSGKVAGAAFPFVEMATYETVAPIKFRYFWNPLVKNIGNTTYATSPETLAAKGDLFRRFTRANTKAAILIRENPAVAARYFLEGAGIKVTDESIAHEVQLLSLTQDQLAGFNATSPRIGYTSPVGLNFYERFLIQSGYMTDAPPLSAVLTNEFIAYANDFDHNAFIAQVKKMH